MPCTKAFAKPIAETHNTTMLSRVLKGNLQEVSLTLKKYEGAILVKKTGIDSLMFRSVDSIAFTLWSDVCTNPGQNTFS